MEVTSQGCGKQSHSGIEVEGEFPRLTSSNDPDQLIRQVAVGLKERTGADAIAGPFSLVRQIVCAERDQLLFAGCVSRTRLRCSEGDCACDMGHELPLFQPSPYARTARFSPAPDLYQQ